MTKKWLRLALVAGAAALAAPALAGDGNGAFQCDNACPLAQQANTMRSFGGEWAAPHATALTAAVRRNLERI